MEGHKHGSRQTAKVLHNLKKK